MSRTVLAGLLGVVLAGPALAEVPPLYGQTMAVVSDIKQRIDHAPPASLVDRILTPSQARMMNECPELTRWYASYSTHHWRGSDEDVAKMMVGCNVALDIIEGRAK
jgi:hypothetical protein